MIVALRPRPPRLSPQGWLVLYLLSQAVIMVATYSAVVFCAGGWGMAGCT